MSEWNKCPGCLETTGGLADYCPKCGEQLNVRCPHCGLTWRFWQKHRFCPKCGCKTACAMDRSLVTAEKRQGEGGD
jgi:hypothetical protein